MPNTRQGDNRVSPNSVNSVPTESDYDKAVASAKSTLSSVPDDFFTRLLMPGWVADEDYARQVQLMDLQNQYNDPAAQMARMKAAGINPNVAAAGIAGNFNATASAPSVNSGQAAASESAQGLSGIANAAVGAATGLASQGGILDNLSTLALRKDKLSKEIGSLLKGMGYTDAQTRSLEVSLKYLDEKESLGVATMMANLDNICLQYDMFNQQIAESKKRMSEMDAQIALYRNQGDLANALKLQADKNTSILEMQRLEFDWYKSMREIYGIDFHRDPYHMLVAAALQGKTDVVDALSNGVYDFNYNVSLGGFDARVNTVFDEMFNSAAGQAAGNAENEKFLSFLRQNEYWVKQYLEFKFSPDYEIFLSKLSGWLGPEYEHGHVVAEDGRGMPVLDSVSPRTRYNHSR